MPSIITRALTKVTGAVACATLISKIISYVAAVVIGAKFGASRATDTYLISLIIPDFLILLFAAPLGLGLTTLLTQDIAKGNEKQGWEFIAVISSLLLAILLLSAAIIFFLSPYILFFLTPGFDSASRALAAKLNRIALGYMFFAGLAYIPRGILHSYRRFLIPALSPGLLQLAVILFIFLYSDKFNILSINMGLCCGAAICFILHSFCLRNKLREFNFRLKWNLRRPRLKETLTLAGSLFLYCIVFQVNTGVDRVVASTLKAGSITALDFAYRVNWMFLPVFAGAVFTVLLPILSEQAAFKKWEDFKGILYSGIKLLNFLIAPISIFIIFMATPLIKLLFERGAFGASATMLTSQALVMYSLGAVPFVMLHVNSCALIALRDSKSLAKISIILIFLNAVLDLILSRYLGHRGIALATSIVSVFGFWLYIRALRAQIGVISVLDMLGGASFIKIIFSSFVAALTSLFMYGFLGPFINTAGFIGQLIQMGAVFLIAAGVYFGLAYILGINEIKEMYLLFKKNKV